MKVNYIHAYLNLLINCVFSQNNIIPNYDFEKAQPSKFPQCNYQIKPNDFNSDIENWRNAKHNIDKGSGSADWLTHNNCINSSLCGSNGVILLNNTRMILICSDIFKCKNKESKFLHEAVAVSLENNMKFEKGKNYIIRYKVSTAKAKILSKAFNLKPEAEAICEQKSLTSHMRVFLSEKGFNNWNDNNSQKQELINANFFKISNFPICDYTIEERKFTPNSDVYTTLVLFAESGCMLIDDVEIFEECEDNYFIQNKIYESPFYLPNSVNGLENFFERSSNTIVAGNNVTSSKPYGDVIIKNISYSNSQPFVTFSAQNRVVLKSGFKAEKGTRFKAINSNCSYNNRINQYYIDTVKKFYHSEEEDDDNFLGQYKVLDKIFIKPNPNNGIFKISLNEKPHKIIIRNTFFKELKSIIVEDEEITLNMSEFDDGVYLLEFIYNDRLKIYKVIKSSN
jgi:ssDNA-binding Zn-finger/Zn-ribbon topoisomerase 1